MKPLSRLVTVDTVVAESCDENARVNDDHGPREGGACLGEGTRSAYSASGASQDLLHRGVPASSIGRWLA
ncbi:MAG: hypothetical protein ACRDVP_07785 [Acidimicrobiales bacterium]